jgi:membrane-associated phospholipid phosphatase
MQNLFYGLPKTLKNIFSGFNLLWLALAIALTYIIIVSGFDWTYSVFFRHGFLYNLFFPGAGLLGFVVPVFLPLSLLAIGKLRQSTKITNTAWALGQAALLGVVLSSFFKVFTGRPGPELLSGGVIDITHIFRFGIFRGGIFWGWPSSHTTVAFAVCVALIYLYPKNKTIIVTALLFALYIGFGASMSFHWLSDCIAGAILGTLIGHAVGTSFSKKLNP